MNFVINQNKLFELLKDFYTLTKIRTVVFDDRFSEMISYPNHYSTYCRILRECESANKKCMICDKEACLRSKNGKKTIIYKCHAGLYEAVTPISYENVVVGYIMFGQILKTEDKEKSWQEILPTLSNYSVDVNALKTAYFKKKNLTENKIKAASKILEACSGYLYLLKIISLSNDSIENNIEKFITSNLSETLSVDIICDKFAISKARLNNISNHCYGMGICEHIKNLRIAKAEELLKHDDKRINEIAVICGIPDYNYFTKVFKLKTGVTPSEYRKKQKQL